MGIRNTSFTMAPPATARSMLGIQPSTASTSDSALVIIDAQNEYANGLLQVTNVDQSRVAIASLLQKYRDAKAPVIHVVHEVPEGAPVFTPGTALAAEFDELKPLEANRSSPRTSPAPSRGL